MIPKNRFNEDWKILKVRDPARGEFSGDEEVDSTLYPEATALIEIVRPSGVERRWIKLSALSVSLP